MKSPWNPNGGGVLFPRNFKDWAFDSRDLEPARELDAGMGKAVGRRTVFRPADAEDWGRVADRVAAGNCLMGVSAGQQPSHAEARALRNAIARGAILTSGRHLQHGDLKQPTRNQEVFCNCATTSVSFLLAYLLLNGSGVGRSYDDAMMLVDWAQAPQLQLVLDPKHPDYPSSPQQRADLWRACMGWQAPQASQEEMDAFAANWIKPGLPDDEIGKLFRIPDSREGWAQAVEVLESMTWAGVSGSRLTLNFNDIRPCGSPIAGMQDRPASGPVSWMRAFIKLSMRAIEPAKAGLLAPWAQAMWVDHCLAEEVLVAGVRRAARMSTKDWRDPGIFDFIRIKESGGLWTSNNSIMVDAEFWAAAREPGSKANAIFEEATRCAYINGEPGFINGDKLEDTRLGLTKKHPLKSGSGSRKYQFGPGKELLDTIAANAGNIQFPTTCNPCAEIPLSVTGGFCVIADVAPVLACPAPLDSFEPGWMPVEDAAYWDSRVRDSIALATRFLIRVNLMDSIYGEEVRRTNRIGVGLTGIHEWAWLRFGLSFQDLLQEHEAGRPFWEAIAAISQEAKAEAAVYSAILGVQRPFTITTAKPSGSVSKLFALTEGAHLPGRRQYLRWVQFKGSRDADGAWTTGSDPLLQEHIDAGYPTKELKSFPGMTAIGFPTQPLLTRLGMGEKMVCASEATPEQHYQWLRLLEKYWLGEEGGNQLSYTLRVDTSHFDLEAFRTILLENQPTVRCCSILPSKPDAELGFEYLPEESVTDLEYAAIVANIKEPVEESIDLESLRCESGVCPI